MRNKYRILLAVLLVAFFGALAWLVLIPHEPVYKGRTLASWLDEFGTNYSAIFQATKEATLQTDCCIAIQRIGTNAVPTLVNMASSHDSNLESNLVVLARRLTSVHLHTDQEYHIRARLGFFALGPLGKDAVPSLIDLLGDKDPEIQITTIACLGNIGPAANAAVPALIPFLSDTNQSVRLGATRTMATRTLGSIHSEPGLVVPLLIKDLNASNPQLAITISALGQFGKDAKPAVPALLQYLSNQNGMIWRETINALKAIDPEAAAKAGIK